MSRLANKENRRRRVRKCDREQAILICQIAASSPESTTYVQIAAELGWNRGNFWTQQPCIDLAYDAYMAAAHSENGLGDMDDLVRVNDAFAAVLLEEGWRP